MEWSTLHSPLLKEEPSDNLKECFSKLTIFSEIMGVVLAGTKLLHLNLWSDYEKAYILKACFKVNVGSILMMNILYYY